MPILNILVPQVGQIPSVAGLPFFMVTAFESFMSRFALHFTQYASNAMSFPFKKLISDALVHRSAGLYPTKSSLQGVLIVLRDELGS